MFFQWTAKGYETYNQIMTLICCFFTIPAGLFALFSIIKNSFGHTYHDADGNKHTGYYVDETGSKFLLKFTTSFVPYDEEVHGQLSELGVIKGIVSQPKEI